MGNILPKTNRYYDSHMINQSITQIKEQQRDIEEINVRIEKIEEQTLENLQLLSNDIHVLSERINNIDHKVDILTLGQYLRPTLNHLPVKRWVTPPEFNKYREIGLKKGFLEIVSGPMVRSSYRAEKALEKNNAGLGMTNA